jgi:uncharacterized protein YyaL (SSP411 family)
MARESFEDPEVADALNRNFVSIKLDREERPDLDEVYMTAVQLANGHGGWPMTLFLTPEKKPFFAGTYFPREARGGLPGFRSLVTSLAQAWREQREDVMAAAGQFAAALVSGLERMLPFTVDRLEAQLFDEAIDQLHLEFDNENGGFGGRPKFPPHAALRFLTDYARVRPTLDGDPGDRVSRAHGMVAQTLGAMAHGGLFDHVSGGFHRYSTDESWRLPHFEKMLYDSAQLLEAYARTGGGRTADLTAEWIVRDMTLPNGMLAAAIDADSEGGEGAYYLWTVEQIREALGDAADEVIEAFQCTVEGNYLDETTGLPTGKNVLHLMRGRASSPGSMERLREARSRRPSPLRDEKAVAAWNGLALSGLVASGRLDSAKRLASAWLPFVEAGLPHQVVDNRPMGAAFLDDLAYLANGLLDLQEADGGQWGRAASVLMGQALESHAVGDRGLAYVSRLVEAPFGRHVPFTDGVTPSPVAISVRVMRRLGMATEAGRLLWSGMGWIERAPRACLSLLGEALEFLRLGLKDPPGGRPVRVPTFAVRLEPSELKVGSDGWAHADLVIDCPPGWHINSDDPSAEWLTPTTLRLAGALGEAGFPDAPGGVLDGEIRLPLRLRPVGGEEFEVTVRFQPCSESECRAPEERAIRGRFARPSSTM